MFANSSQKRHWTFSTEERLWELQDESNKHFISKYSPAGGTDASSQKYLTTSEEIVLKRYYDSALREFSAVFRPEMPRSVTALAVNYMKRFYLYNSVMDYHPRDIMLTCAFHACKVDEFNVSIKQFVGNIKGDRAKHGEVILGFEHLLMCELRFHLTIHLPYRPLEGLLIYYKTYYPDENGENLREGALAFLDKSLLTDVSLLHAPSQIALAALCHAASTQRANLNDFVEKELSCGDDDLARETTIVTERIRKMVSAVTSPDRSVIKTIDRKLALCRNIENDPRSAAFEAAALRRQDEEEGRQADKYSRRAAEQSEAAEKFMSI